MPRFAVPAALSLAATLALILVAVPARAPAQAPAGPAYTAAQADRGAATYKDNCALCHGDDMSGGAGIPALAGPDFTFGYKGKPAQALFDYVRTNMPPGGAGSLSDQQYLDIVTAILKKNGVAPGATELTPTAAGLKAPLSF
jgi:mono/diheme cytochrome c family protein